MKRAKLIIIPLATLFGIFCTVDPLAAVPSFGTIMPGAGEWEAGTQANFIFKRDVRDHRRAESSQYFYNLSFGFADWFSFDAKLGMGDVSVRPVLEDGRLHYRSNFAGGYGWRAKIFEDKKTNIKGTLGFQHISVHPSRKEINSVKYDIIWDDWQVQFLAFKEMANLQPYCGMKGSLLYLIRSIGGNRTRRRSGDYIGLIVGTDLRMNDYIYVNVEGRFFDETALSTGFTVKY